MHATTHLLETILGAPETCCVSSRRVASNPERCLLAGTEPNLYTTATNHGTFSDITHTP